MKMKEHYVKKLFFASTNGCQIDGQVTNNVILMYLNITLRENSKCPD